MCADDGEIISTNKHVSIYGCVAKENGQGIIDNLRIS